MIIVDIRITRLGGGLGMIDSFGIRNSTLKAGDETIYEVSRLSDGKRCCVTHKRGDGWCPLVIKALSELGAGLHDAELIPNSNSTGDSAKTQKGTEENG